MLRRMMSKVSILGTRTMAELVQAYSVYEQVTDCAISMLNKHKCSEYE